MRNFSNVLIFILFIFYSVILVIERKFKEIEKLFVLLLIASIMILSLYGDIYTLHRYIVITLVPVSYFVFTMYSLTKTAWSKILIWLILLGNLAYNIPTFIKYYNQKKETKIFIDNINNLYKHEKDLTFYLSKNSIKYAILKYHFPSVENKNFILFDATYLGSIREFNKNSYTIELVANKCDFKFEEVYSRIYKMTEKNVTR